MHLMLVYRSHADDAGRVGYRGKKDGENILVVLKKLAKHHLFFTAKSVLSLLSLDSVTSNILTYIISEYVNFFTNY